MLAFNPLNADLNPVCHLLALLGAHHILHISRIRVNAPLLICCILDYTIRKLLKSGGTGIDKRAVCTGDVNLLDVH